MFAYWQKIFRSLDGDDINFPMAKPYGIFRRKRSTKTDKTDRASEPLKIKLRGKDDAPLSMREIRDGMYEAAQALLPHETTLRAKWVTLYLTLIDGDGTEVRLNDKNELVIFPYKSAADEFGA